MLRRATQTLDVAPETQLMTVSVPLRRALFFAAAIFALVMAVLPHPPELPGEPSDKIQHMAAFATLGLLGAWAYAGAALLQLLAGLSLFGAFIEVVQAIPALHRDSDVKDWIADTIAAAAVLLLVHWRRMRRREAVRE
jgi:VanZ family protein